MSDFAPKPTILPVTINVSIPHKGILVRRLSFQPKKYE
jgi:hypothetical protein